MDPTVELLALTHVIAGLCTRIGTAEARVLRIATTPGADTKVTKADQLGGVRAALHEVRNSLRLNPESLCVKRLERAMLRMEQKTAAAAEGDPIELSTDDLN